MGKAIDDAAAAAADAHETGHRRDLRKAMSDNVAYALIIYTALQIFMTVHAMKQGVSSILPYLALVVLVAGIIPACRWFEKRWKDLPDSEAHDPALSGAFKREAIAVWAVAIGLPLAMTMIFKTIFA